MKFSRGTKQSDVTKLHGKMFLMLGEIKLFADSYHLDFIVHKIEHRSFDIIPIKWPYREIAYIHTHLNHNYHQWGFKGKICKVMADNTLKIRLGKSKETIN